MIQHGMVDFAEEDFKQRFMLATKHLPRAQKDRDHVADELTPDTHVSNLLLVSAVPFGQALTSSKQVLIKLQYWVAGHS